MRGDLRREQYERIKEINARIDEAAQRVKQPEPPTTRVLLRGELGAKAAPLNFVRRETPKEFVARRAREHMISMADLLGRSLKPIHVKPRWDIIRGLHETFPKLSMNQIGALMNRDHTSIISAYCRMGLQPHRKYYRLVQWTDEMDETLRRLWPDPSISLRRIAERLQIGRDAMGRRARLLGIPRGKMRQIPRGRHLKLTPDLVRFVRKSDQSAVFLSKCLGISETAIKDARRGKTWAHVQ